MDVELRHDAQTLPGVSLGLWSIVGAFQLMIGLATILDLLMAYITTGGWTQEIVDLHGMLSWVLFPYQLVWIPTLGMLGGMAWTLSHGYRTVYLLCSLIFLVIGFLNIVKTCLREKILYIDKSSVGSRHMVTIGIQALKVMNILSTFLIVVPGVLSIVGIIIDYLIDKNKVNASCGDGNANAE